MLVLDSHDVLLRLDNVHIQNSAAANILVGRDNAPGGANPVVMVNNFIAEEWDTPRYGWASLVAGANCNIIVGFNRLFKTTNPNPVYTSGAVALGQ